MTNQKMQQAVEYYKSGDKQNAEKFLAEVVELDPDNASAWYGLALCMDELEQREYYLQRVLKINPKHPQARKYLAKARRNKILSLSFALTFLFGYFPLGFFGWFICTSITRLAMSLFEPLGYISPLISIIVIITDIRSKRKAMKPTGIAIGIITAMVINVIYWTVIIAGILEFSVSDVLNGFVTPFYLYYVYMGFLAGIN